MAIRHEYMLSRFVNSKGTQKLVLKITDYGDKKYFDVLLDKQKVYLTNKEFDKLQKSTVPRLIEVHKHINDDRERVREILNKIQPYSYQKFKEQYGSGKLLSDCFDRKIKELRKDEKFGSAKNYDSAKKSFIKFNDIKVGEVNDNYLDEFVKQGGSQVSLQRLRHILGREGNPTLVKLKQQPNHKTPLSEESMELMKNYKSLSIARMRSVDLFMMGYFGGGMNVKDWVFLKVDQIENELIQRPRSKTGQPLVIVINEKLRILIDKYYNPKHGYAFQFIDHSLQPEALDKRYNTFLNNMRRSLREVRQELSIPEKVTPYVSRSSHANILMNRGASIEDIQSSLGQRDIRSTKAYLGSMNLKNKKRVSDLL